MGTAITENSINNNAASENTKAPQQTTAPSQEPQPQENATETVLASYPANYYVNMPKPANSTAQTVQNPTYTYPANYYAGQQIPGQQTSGVNIMIFNPSVTPPGGTVNTSCNYVLPPTNNAPPQIIQSPPPAPQPPVIVEKKTPKAEKTKTKEVTELTDDLVKSIENYLRNQNREIRLLGVKKLVEILKEDPQSRKDDVALNNLVNLALQDKDRTIRTFALSAVRTGLASGDALTTELLNGIMNSSNPIGGQEIAAAAALNRVGKKQKIKVPDDSSGNGEKK